MPSNISWTEDTLNVITGCTRVSAECDNCYAIRMSKRVADMGSVKQVEKYGRLTKQTPHGLDWTGDVRVHPEELKKISRWTKPRLVFVNSMSDTFHHKVGIDFLDRFFGVMALHPQHIFQLLTKRPERAYVYLAAAAPHIASMALRGRIDFPLTFTWPLPNVWLGTTIGTQDAAEKRLSYLKKSPAAVRYISMEPLLESVTLPSLEGIDQVIVGGESGPGARSMDLDWCRSIRDQCREAGVAFHMKQLSQRDFPKTYKKFETFPEDLQIREYPDALYRH